MKTNTKEFDTKASKAKRTCTGKFGAKAAGHMKANAGVADAMEYDPMEYDAKVSGTMNTDSMVPDAIGYNTSDQADPR